MPTAAPLPAGRTIGTGALRAALGVPRTTLIRWIAEGRIPEPMRAPGEPAGTWRRWRLADAIAIVRGQGQPVPVEWETATQKAA